MEFLSLSLFHTHTHTHTQTHCHSFSHTKTHFHRHTHTNNLHPVCFHFLPLTFQTLLHTVLSPSVPSFSLFPPAQTAGFRRFIFTTFSLSYADMSGYLADELQDVSRCRAKPKVFDAQCRLCAAQTEPLNYEFLCIYTDYPLWLRCWPMSTHGLHQLLQEKYASSRVSYAKATSNSHEVTRLSASSAVHRRHNQQTFVLFLRLL